MSEDLVSRLWSWSVHTGDPLFAEAAERIEQLTAANEDLNKELIRAWTSVSAAAMASIRNF